VLVVVGLLLVPLWVLGVNQLLLSPFSKKELHGPSKFELFLSTRAQLLASQLKKADMVIRNNGRSIV
jgi:hypothetical protein